MGLSALSHTSVQRLNGVLPITAVHAAVASDGVRVLVTDDCLQCWDYDRRSASLSPAATEGTTAWRGRQVAWALLGGL